MNLTNETCTPILPTSHSVGARTVGLPAEYNSHIPGGMEYLRVKPQLWDVRNPLILLSAENFS